MRSRLQLHEVIDLVLVTLDARDPYTYEHSCRVALYSEMISREMQLPTDMHERTQVAAHLHDIGKVAISDDVLNKAGRLNRDEKLEIQRHPSIGFNILSRLPSFTEVATIVLHHHERFDGDGYPERLAGEDIPLESRIIAVADAFDAMNSSRPYRKAMTVDQALAEVALHAGIQFDPDIAAILCRLRDEIREHLINGPGPVNGGQHAYVGHEDLMHSRSVRGTGFFVEDEHPTRRAIPSTLFGRDWTRNLYGRYHTLQHRANRKGLPFRWTQFADLLTSLAVVAPDDYHPGTHRFSFDLERTDDLGYRLGYCQDTRSLKPRAPSRRLSGETSIRINERAASRTKAD
jgi:putative nucleotidyltransferase with HDIG domain